MNMLFPHHDTFDGVEKIRVMLFLKKRANAQENVEMVDGQTKMLTVKKLLHALKISFHI